MPANPYVPAGLPSQQALWVQAYYRNLALQNQYDQQPDWGDALGAGLGKGIGAGAGQYLDVLDQNAKFGAQSDLLTQSSIAQADNQRRAFQQQSDMEDQRMSNAADAEQRKAMAAQAQADAERRNLGLTMGVMSQMRNTPMEGTGLPASESGAKGNEAYVPAVPAKFPDQSQAYASMLGMPGGDVMAGIAAKNHEAVKTIFDTPKVKGPWDEVTLGRIKEASSVAGYDPALARALTADTPAAGLALKPKPDAPDKLTLPRDFNAYIVSLGYTPEQFSQLPVERMGAIRDAYKLEDEQRQIRIQKSRGEAEATITDARQRGKEADEATRDFTTIRTMIPQIQAKAMQLLQPGIAGKTTGLAKEKMQSYFGTYPELQELVSMGEAIKGAVARRVLLESGMLSTFDVSRTEALIPKPSDNLETAVAKTRVLQTFMDASLQAWDAYRQSGLLGAGRPAAKTVNDFLPQNFWNQATRLSPPEPPAGAKLIKPGNR